MISGIYLAYPIDQRLNGPNENLDFMFRQIETLKTSLIDAQLVEWIFDPGDAFVVGGNPRDDGVATVNRSALNMSDVVLAFLPKGVPSIGVPMEIDRARAQGKHVLVFSETDSYMLKMRGISVTDGWTDDHMIDAISWIAGLEPPAMSKQYTDLPFLVGPDGELPKRTHDDDAGLDLYCSENTLILPGEFVDVPCDLSVELPSHKWGLITGRSSTLRTRGLLVHTGVIDPGYRGQLFSGAWNMNEKGTDNGEYVLKGERIAQFIVMNNATQYVTPIKVERLLPSSRGSSGFGSSGA